MKNKQRILTLMILFIISSLKSDTASPSSFLVNQPNGLSLDIYIRGNYLQSWYEYQGSTIIKDENNWWVYASGNKGTNMEASIFRVGLEENPFEGRLIRPDPDILIDDAPIPNLNNTRSDTFHIPWILVDFPNASAVYEPSEFDLILNQPGYTHLNHDNTGSFRDFYKEISYGQFSPKSEVSNWFTASNNHDYYGYNNGYGRVRELVREMVDALEESGFDWSKFDNDGDGYVDALNVIHQGPGAEEGDETNIWSHKWSLGNSAVTYDGVTISSYTINPEIQSGNIVAIGVLAHEFGHALGLPDLYDTDNSSTGAGKLSLMASGSWGTNGNTPWYPSTMVGWCKNRLGWVEIIEIENDQTEIVLNQTYSSNQIIKVNHPQVNEEYWLIENRQKIGSDTLIPTPGLAIWHINDNIANSGNVNVNEPYYGVGLEQADGLFALENGGQSNGGDLFPGNTNNREFSHASNPSTTSLYGLPSMTRIDQISDSNENMTFDVTYSEIILANASINDGDGNAYSSGSITLSLENDMELSEFEFALDFSPSFVDIINATPLARTSFDSIIVIDNSVVLVNPTISAGDGPILTIELFNNVGVEAEVLVRYDKCLAYTVDGNEVGITTLDNAIYNINSVNQYYTIQGGSGTIGAGASFQVTSINTVPISLSVIQLSESLNILTPSDEPFDDLNNNGTYDSGEPFTDWNQNQQWSPMIESDLSENWEISLSISGSIWTIAISNWQEPLEFGPNPLFMVNCIVSDDAELNDVTTISTDIITQVDMWGNNGVPFVNGSGTITVDQILSNDSEQAYPKEFKLDRVYPNPFNNSALIDFSVPNQSNNNIKITFYDINGKVVDEIKNQFFSKGKHTIAWNASSISNGIYFIELNAGGSRTIQKLTLLK
jgi:immune inhibitor A